MCIARRLLLDGNPHPIDWGARHALTMGWNRGDTPAAPPSIIALLQRGGGGQDPLQPGPAGEAPLAHAPASSGDGVGGPHSHGAGGAGGAGPQPPEHPLDPVAVTGGGLHPELRRARKRGAPCPPGSPRPGGPEVRVQALHPDLLLALPSSSRGPDLQAQPSAPLGALKRRGSSPGSSTSQARRPRRSSPGGGPLPGAPSLGIHILHRTTHAPPGAPGNARAPPLARPARERGGVQPPPYRAGRPRLAWPDPAIAGAAGPPAEAGGREGRGREGRGALRGLGRSRSPTHPRSPPASRPATLATPPPAGAPRPAAGGLRPAKRRRCDRPLWAEAECTAPAACGRLAVAGSFGMLCLACGTIFGGVPASREGTDVPVCTGWCPVFPPAALAAMATGAPGFDGLVPWSPAWIAARRRGFLEPN